MSLKIKMIANRITIAILTNLMIGLIKRSREKSPLGPILLSLLTLNCKANIRMHPGQLRMLQPKKKNCLSPNFRHRLSFLNLNAPRKSRKKSVPFLPLPKLASKMPMGWLCLQDLTRVQTRDSLVPRVTMSRLNRRSLWTCLRQRATMAEARWSRLRLFVSLNRRGSFSTACRCRAS